MKGYERIWKDMKGYKRIWKDIFRKSGYDLRTYPRKDILHRYPVLSSIIHIYPKRYPKKISLFISRIVIQLYPIIFFYIQKSYPNKYPIVYPIKISHGYLNLSQKISWIHIHIHIHYSYPIISHCILLYPKKISK